MAFTKAYQEYLKSKKWAEKRQQCFAYHGKRCKACAKTRGPIHVHHMDYTRLFREDPAKDLVPLCVSCHREVTRLYRRNRRRGLRRVTIEFISTKKSSISRRPTGS